MWLSHEDVIFKILDPRLFGSLRSIAKSYIGIEIHFVVFIRSATVKGANAQD